MTSGKKKLHRFVFGRGLVAFLLLVIQVALAGVFYQFFSDLILFFWEGAILLNVIVLVYLVNNRSNPQFKLAWILPILLLPVFGTFLYLFTRLQTATSRLGRRYAQIIAVTRPYLVQDSLVQASPVLAALRQTDPQVASTAFFMSHHAGFPVYTATAVDYYPLGEAVFAALVADLATARDFIFLEFFIIEPGLMWDTILDILARKVLDGVEVRVMYDGMIAMYTLPYDYPRVLQALGIHCRIFSPIRPALSTVQNNRDHRKILVVDGRVGFTGGVNLADEYINRRVRFGHWKDTAVRLEGPAVQSLTMLFLQMWDTAGLDYSPYARYLPWPGPGSGAQKPQQQLAEELAGKVRLPAAKVEQAGTSAGPAPGMLPATPGFVLPYGDSPLDYENIGEQVYFDILHQSTHYVHIMTPYLVLDSEMLTALTHTARRGVEVVIILPHIPDKLIAFWVARTFYPELIEAGVRIFEYTPGFLHAKSFVADGDRAVVGTINLDFRSLYLHFECAVYFYAVPAISQIEEDFQQTLVRSQEISLSDYQSLPIWQRAAGRFLRLFAPLM